MKGQTMHKTCEYTFVRIGEYDELIFEREAPENASAPARRDNQEPVPA